MYSIELLTPHNHDNWDSIIKQCSNATVFQSIEWCDALAQSFKQLDPDYLLIKHDEKVIGGLPAFVFQPIPGIRMWNSMPWSLFGGPQIIDSVQVNPIDLISAIDTYLETTSKEKAWCETSWTLSPTDSIKYGDCLTQHRYERTERFTHILNTNSDIDTLWNAYNKRVRGAVRKAKKSGVKVTNTDTDEDLSTFYEIYLMTLKRLGGTPKPRKLMKTLLERDIAKLAIAKYNNTIIAGLLYLHYNHTVTLWCEASLPEYLQYRPNNAIFHHIITWACENRYKSLDFGASPPGNEGLVAHKEQYRAKRTDFYSYTKTISPFKKSLWTSSEGMLRAIYTWLQ